MNTPIFMRQFAVFSCAFTLLLCDLPGQTVSGMELPGTFTQLDFDCGGYVSGFAVHATGRVYCKANVGGLYRSDNHGETWQWLSADMPGAAAQMPHGVMVLPSNPDVVIQTTGTSYLASDPSRGIYKSIDGGATWKQVQAKVNFSGNDEAQYGGSTLICMPGNEKELWTISRGDGLWKSVDAGDTWVRADTGVFGGLVGCCVYASPAFPDQIWVGCEKGLFFSADHGKNWKKIRDMGRCFRVARFDDGTTLIAGGTDGKPQLFRVSSKDWNKADPATFQWTDLSSIFRDAWAELPLLTICAGESLVFAGSNMATWTSRDKGLTWEKLEPRLDLKGDQPIWQRKGEDKLLWGRNEIVQDPSDLRRLYMGSGLNLLVSLDEGKTWRNSYKGIAMVCCYKAAFSREREGLVFIPSMDQHCMILTDGGRSGTAAWCLAERAKSEGVASGARILTGGNQVRLFMTRFGVDGARIVESNGSLDQLDRWTEVKPAGIPLVAFSDGLQARDNPLEYLLVAGDQAGPGKGGIYRTVDGGKTFKQATGIPAGTRMGYYWSLNGYNSLCDDPINPDRRYYLSFGQGFLRSDDRGQSWKPAGKNLKGKDGQLARDDDGTLWAAMGNGWGGGKGMKGNCLSKSTDGGDTWTTLGDFSCQYPRVDAVKGHIVVYGKRSGDQWDGIWYSADKGLTWGRIDRPGNRFPTVNGLAIDPWNPLRVWISTNGRSAAVFELASKGE